MTGDSEPGRCGGTDTPACHCPPRYHDRVADPAQVDSDTAAIRAFNASLPGDDRFDLSLVPIADGLTLCRRRT